MDGLVMAWEDLWEWCWTIDSIRKRVGCFGGFPWRNGSSKKERKEGRGG